MLLTGMKYVLFPSPGYRRNACQPMKRGRIKHPVAISLERVSLILLGYRSQPTRTFRVIPFAAISTGTD